jgi:hypothetical protein
MEMALDVGKHGESQGNVTVQGRSNDGGSPQS